MGKHLYSARSTENAKENASDIDYRGAHPDMPGWVDKNFQGEFFSTIIEKFYPRIKIFGGE